MLLLCFLANGDLVDSVSNIKDRTATLTISLAAQAVLLSDVAGSYELEFGHAISIRQSQQPQGRSLLGNAENTGDSVLNSAEGNVNQSTQSYSFNIGAGQEGQRSNIFADQG